MDADGSECMVTKETICLRCVARGGLISDRCERCKDYSAFKRGRYSTESLEGLTARGKLAFVLSELPGQAEGVLVDNGD